MNYGRKALNMKNNQETAASVFEKSRIVLQRRAVRRKRIATAASTLSAAAVITVAALLSKGAFSKDIPTQDPPVISDNSSAASSSHNSSLGTAATASAVTSSSPSEESRKESKTESSSSNASSKKSSSSSSSGASGKASKTSSTTAADGRSSASVSPDRSSDTAHEAESKTNDPKTSSSKTTSSKTASSKSTSSKNTNSKNTSSKAASSNNTSSKATSSKSTSSKTTSSESTSSQSSRYPYIEPAETDTPSPANDGKDEERPVPEAPDGPDSPGVDDAPDHPTEKNPNDFSDGEPGIPDTDTAAAESLYEFVPYYGETYRNADDLVRGAQLVIVGDVSKILFTRGSEDLAPLRSDFDSSGSDLYTVVTVDISDVLKGKAHSDRITFTMYGGMLESGTYTVQQTYAGWGNAVPLVECREDPELYQRYIFVLDFNEGSGRWTLHTYQDGIISVDHPNGVIMPGDVLQACRD